MVLAGMGLTMSDNSCSLLTADNSCFLGGVWRDRMGDQVFLGEKKLVGEEHLLVNQSRI